MTYAEIIMAIAAVTGPIAAVLISLWQSERITRSREEKKRKEDVFKTLMATRANRLSQDHVRALNLIDVVFTKKEQRVLDAWKAYMDTLDHYLPENGQANNIYWAEKSDAFFIDMIFEMSTALGFSFDKVLLKRHAYSPIAHAEIEKMQLSVLQGFSEIVAGKNGLPIYPLQGPPSPPSEAQRSEQLS